MRLFMTPYLGWHFVTGLDLRMVKGRLGLGVSACRQWVMMVGILGAQVELCKARSDSTGLTEGLRASDHGRRRRRGGSTVTAL